jgi:hypothetical protein
MTPSRLRAELKLRSFPPHGITDVHHRTLVRLHRLVDRGTLSTLDVDVWGSHAVTDAMRDHDDSGTLEAISEFERWAEERGCTLAPAFATRECGSILDGGTREVTVVPLVTLAVYGEDGLRAVYPHRDGERVHTVGDGLAALESMAPSDEDSTGNRVNGRGNDRRVRSVVPAQ